VFIPKESNKKKYLKKLKMWKIERNRRRDERKGGWTKNERRQEWR